ncbi:hypothetical protein E2P81_ATG09858 [Venturia nashicola]|uniref:Uncharacterized protein n=1 Tax=Venturia nashicola TaxID=86259 RepID=A0A4Z1P0J4_9PEZI|nr:hypothetical protein E6O75_ATG10075 [Venturia nashicola]TLD15010.1 hypothetical protein E2P81_ATG09858 [Venturia nashicola]
MRAMLQDILPQHERLANPVPSDQYTTPSPNDGLGEDGDYFRRVESPWTAAPIRDPVDTGTAIGPKVHFCLFGAVGPAAMVEARLVTAVSDLEARLGQTVTYAQLSIAVTDERKDLVSLSARSVHRIVQSCAKNLRRLTTNRDGFKPDETKC